MENKNTEGAKMENMTKQKLENAAREYDAINNEGAEGYNPYRAELDRRDLEARKAAPRSKYSLQRELMTISGPRAKELGIYDETRIAALEAAIAQIDAEADAVFAAEWTRDVTTTRRAAWNTFVRSGNLNGFADLARTERQQGWRLDDLKRAVKLHQL